MMKENQLQEIEAFLSGKLSITEQKEVEQKIAEDENFATAVGEMKDLFLLVNVAGDATLKGKFERIGEELSKEKNKSPFWLRAFFIVAFVGASVLGAYFLIQSATDKNAVVEPEIIYASYFEPYRSPSNVRGETFGSSPDELWTDAVTYYEKGEFENARKSWEDYAQQQKKDDYLTNFYIGVSSLGSDKPNQAITALEKVLTIDNDFQQQAQWYIALAYLKAENPTAKPLFEGIGNMENHYKKEEALEILKQIALLKGW